MVDESFAIDSIKKEGQIITFSTSEAIKYGFCEAKVESVDEILRRNNITDYAIERFELSVTDKIISIFINPFISGILILIILGGIYFEMQSPGIGFALLASVVAMVLYLVPYYLNGLADNWEIITLFLGIALLGVEIFVLPGFGVAGIAGITLTLGSLILVMVNNNVFDFEFVPANDLLFAMAAAFGGLLGGITVLFLAGGRLADSKFFKRVALTDTQQGYTSNFVKEPMTGKIGTAYTVLRPSGKVLIEGQLYDAFTRGEYIEKGETVEVLDEETTSLRVKHV